MTAPMTTTNGQPPPAPQPDPTREHSQPRCKFAAVETALIRRSLRERRRLLFGLSTAAFAIALLVVSLYSSVGEQFDAAFGAVPPALESMFDGAKFGTPEGFVQVELFTFVGPGLVIAAGIAAGSNTIAGAERSGRLTLILSSPVRRRQLVTAAVATTLVSACVVTLALLIGILGGAAIAGVALAPPRAAAACFSLGLLGAAVGLIALAAGAITGNKGLATAISTTAALVSYAGYTFFPLAAQLEPWHRATLWYPFAANQPLINGVNWLHAVVLVGISAGAAVSAYWGFERRDLRT